LFGLPAAAGQLSLSLRAALAVSGVL